MHNTDVEICEITTGTASEPSTLETIQEQSEGTQQQVEGKFICSRADISVHTRVDLQDVEVSGKIQNKCLDVCSTYPQIFSFYSEDFGHTYLVTVDTETGQFTIM